MPTKIEWAEESWNPTTGCDKTSPGCDNCYALGMAKRLKAMGQAKYQADGDLRTSGPGFALTVHPDTLTLPLRWKTPRRVFVNSMSDLFHAGVPDRFIYDVWNTMALTPEHTYQILTKRSKRLSTFPFFLPHTAWESNLGGAGDFMAPDWFLCNVWLGVSVESARYKFRLDHLRETPAAVRWVSFEPLLGPVGDVDLTGIDWVVVGGESGRGARPMHPDWAREIRDQCIQQGVAFFFKQWGNWRTSRVPADTCGVRQIVCAGCAHPQRVGDSSVHSGPNCWMTREQSKNFDGHDLLDGQQWHQYPGGVS